MNDTKSDHEELMRLNRQIVEGKRRLSNGENGHAVVVAALREHARPISKKLKKNSKQPTAESFVAYGNV
jgi:hypothetical protein